MTERPAMDSVLLFGVLGLVGFGLVMVYSASAVYAGAELGDPLFYARRQLLHVGLGLAALWLGWRFGYRRLVRWGYPLLMLTVLLLVAVLIPGLGTRVGGSSRWLRLGLMNFQPAELAKVAFVVYLACSLTRKKEQIQAFSVGFLPHMLVSGLLLVLLLLQPDFGTAATLTILLFFLLFVAGTRLSYLAVSALAALPMAYMLVTGSDYRMRRLLAFMDPWADRYNVGYQITESLMSFGSGGVAGVGLGEGKHKLFFLPAAHTDFIFSQVGEELGFVGATALVAVFGVVVWRGVRAAWRAPDLFGTYLAFGLTALIGMQALVNMGVVTGLLPTKGLTLPFVSYGGSSMICMMLAVGLLLDISASTAPEGAEAGAKVTWP
ncbi:MAG TPA: putative lipid II flippase FtsW [Myxococcota bacterium]|nr:putative lipid II flippase FtsW [Myxococcota bacterium]HRY91903.1 putative lipid II flippase FtsW [Myxococcota bacterium]HSA22718.1 putative lipid II flippase FtsW [Myxococcota bacterium]